MTLTMWRGQRLQVTAWEFLSEEPLDLSVHLLPASDIFLAPSPENRQPVSNGLALLWFLVPSLGKSTGNYECEIM